MNSDNPPAHQDNVIARVRERLLDHAGDLTVGYAYAVPKDLLRQAAALISRTEVTEEMIEAGRVVLFRYMTAETSVEREAVRAIYEAMSSVGNSSEAR